MKKLQLIYIVTLFSASAYAGGSFESVVVVSLKQTGSTSYTLVVRPQPNKTIVGYADPYLGSCIEVTIYGAYSWFYSAVYFPDFVTRSNHKEALSHLKQAQKLGRAVNLGWIGGGFEPVRAESKCVYRSRALQLETQDGTTAVLSYYNPV